MTTKSAFKSDNKMEHFPIKIWNVPGGLSESWMEDEVCSFWMNLNPLHSAIAQEKKGKKKKSHGITKDTY